MHDWRLVAIRNLGPHLLAKGVFLGQKKKKALRGEMKVAGKPAQMA